MRSGPCNRSSSTPPMPGTKPLGPAKLLPQNDSERTGAAVPPFGHDARRKRAANNATQGRPSARRFVGASRTAHRLPSRRSSKRRSLIAGSDETKLQPNLQILHLHLLSRRPPPPRRPPHGPEGGLETQQTRDHNQTSDLRIPPPPATRAPATITTARITETKNRKGSSGLLRQKMPKTKKTYSYYCPDHSPARRRQAVAAGSKRERARRGVRYRRKGEESGIHRQEKGRRSGNEASFFEKGVSPSTP